MVMALRSWLRQEGAAGPLPDGHGSVSCYKRKPAVLSRARKQAVFEVFPQPAGFALALAAAVLVVFAACSRAPVEKRAPANLTAPESYRVNFDASRGSFVIEVHRNLAPLAADRFYNLVKAGYFDGDRFFRVVPGFVVQWGIAPNPEMTKAWDVSFADEPVKMSNERGTVTFAASSQPNSRSTQVFINLANNQRLDAMGFAPFGKVVSGMDVVDQLYSGYGETPDQQLAEREGNSYFEKNFPRLDYIKTAKIAP
jgi:peptidyl-prolyl cis-trans isomerase A (cyclophilin A)